MPKYKKKITRQMSFDEFRQGTQDLQEDRRACLMVLFLAGCRVSEALALSSSDINCAGDTIYVQFFRLKGSKPTDPIPLPRIPELFYLCRSDGELFTFHRATVWRTVKRIWPDLYPHFFRQNRIVDISDKFGDATVYSWVGICAQSIDHYRGKVDIAKVGKALREELG